jgi:hypothetical protein
MVEHGGVHVSVYDPVAGCVIAGSNEDRISLSHGNTYQVYRGCLDIGLQRKEKISSNERRVDTYFGLTPSTSMILIS